MIAHYDKATEKWFAEHPFNQTTVMRCEKCGLLYKPSLGHKCKVAQTREEKKTETNPVEMRTPKKVDLTSVSKVKAVDIETKEIYTYSVVRCPNCGKPITLHKERKFCEHCGQALDWEE